MVTLKLSTCAALLTAAFIFGVPETSAHAAPKTPENAGKTEFDTGVRYFRAQEYEAALPHFRRAYELSNRRPSTIRALAQTERALAMYDDALRHFREFLDTNPKESEAATVRETIALIEELKKDPNAPRPKVTDEIAETPAIDAEPQPSSPPSEPAPEPAPRVERLGDPRSYKPEPTTPAPAQQVTAPASSAFESPLAVGMELEDDHTVPWIITGSGAAVAITGAVLFGLGVADANKVDNAPPGAPYRGEIEDAAERGPMLSTAGAALFTAGVIATGAGIVWLLTD